MADAMASTVELRPYSPNPRRHSAKNVAMIAASLREVGAARSIVIDDDGAILAGRATVEAAESLGLRNYRVVDASGEEIIAVRRSGLSPSQKRRLALFDNRAAELAEWDTDLLAEFPAEDLSGAFSKDELCKLAIESLPPEEPMTESDTSSRTTPGFRYKPQYGVIVICADEAAQRAIYERLTAEGLRCRVVVT